MQIELEKVLQLTDEVNVVNPHAHSEATNIEERINADNEATSEVDKIEHTKGETVKISQVHTVEDQQVKPMKDTETEAEVLSVAGEVAVVQQHNKSEASNEREKMSADVETVFHQCSESTFKVFFSFSFFLLRSFISWLPFTSCPAN